MLPLALLNMHTGFFVTTQTEAVCDHADRNSPKTRQQHGMVNADVMCHATDLVTATDNELHVEVTKKQRCCKTCLS